VGSLNRSEFHESLVTAQVSWFFSWAPPFYEGYFAVSPANRHDPEPIIKYGKRSADRNLFGRSIA